jgi:hypothetical protein
MKLLSLTTLLASATCAIVLACGHPGNAPAAPVPPAPVPVAAAVELTATEIPTGCIEIDTELGGKRTTLEGRIFVDDTHEHPSRGKTHPFILRLDSPRCAIGTDDKQVTEVHLASGEGIALKPLVGKHVRVSGDPFVAHTAWHARPIVFMTLSASRL